MRDLVAILSLIGTNVFALGLILLSLYWRFSNPAMTETQILLTYWPRYLLLIMLVGISYAAHRMAVNE